MMFHKPPARTLSKTERQIEDFQERLDCHKKEILSLEAGLLEIAQRIEALKSKWSNKSDLLRLQLRAKSPLWASSKDQMELLLREQLALKLQLEQEKTSAVSLEDLTNLEPGTGFMRRLEKAGSFRPVSSPVEEPQLDELDERLSDIENNAPQEEEMFFSMESI